MGRSLRELNIQQVQEQLLLSTQSEGEAIIDLVICRSLANNIGPVICQKQRNHSVDTYFNDVLQRSTTNTDTTSSDQKYNDFASIALKLVFSSFH